MAGPSLRPDWGQRLTATASIATVAVAIAALLYTNDANRKQQYLVEQGQITDRFTKAVDQIGQVGAEKIAVRLGGVYALERIMRESQADEPAIIELLSGFLHTYSAVPEGGYEGVGLGSDGEPAPPLVAADVQAVISVLGRRPRAELHENRNLDLQKVNLSGVNLRGANLAFADLRGSKLFQADLSEADLSFGFLVNIDFRGADMTSAKLNEANLTSSSLSGSTSRVTILKNANLTNAKAGFSNFRGADLSGARLWQTDLSLVKLDQANFSGADLVDTKLEYATIKGADLSTAANLTSGQLERTYGDADTKLPSGITAPIASPTPTS